MNIDLSDKTLNALAQVISGGAAGAIESVGLYKRGGELKAWFQRFGVDYEECSRVASTLFQRLGIVILVTQLKTYPSRSPVEP